MQQSQEGKRVRRFQAMSHALAGLNLAYLALSGEQDGGGLAWAARRKYRPQPAAEKGVAG